MAMQVMTVLLGQAAAGFKARLGCLFWGPDRKGSGTQGACLQPIPGAPKAKPVTQTSGTRHGVSLDFAETEQEHGQASPPASTGEGWGPLSREVLESVLQVTRRARGVRTPSLGNGTPRKLRARVSCGRRRAWDALPCPSGQGRVRPPGSAQDSVESRRAGRSHRSYQVAHRPALEDRRPCARFSDLIDILPEFCPVSGR